MELKSKPLLEIPPGLLEAIRSFPVQCEVEHCGVRITVPPFDIYAECRQCGRRIKVRSFSAAAEIEDVFDAVFEWMNQPMAQEMAQRRQEALAQETDDEEGSLC
jgi:transcription elongation factor Elf1